MKKEGEEGGIPMTIEGVKLELIDDNPYQPRQTYHKQDVEDLAASIDIHGLLQVPPGRRHDGRVQLAFGHLRKRAFLKLAKKSPKKWATMPVDIRELNDEHMAMFALEENLRRRDITPIEVAWAVDKYLTIFTDNTEENLAQQLNMTQGNISNMRRVLRLPEQVLEKIEQGRINFTMGRELLVFQGVVAGKTSRWSSKEGGMIATPKDGKYLMLEAIRGIKTEGQWYGEPCTVAGLQKCIHSVARQELSALEKEHCGYGREPMFDTRAAGCLKCEHMIRTHPTKNTAAHWCTDIDCWDKRQKERRDLAAAQARAKMKESVLQKVAAVEEKRQAVDHPGLVNDEQFEKIHASYSADRISEGQPVRKPFEFEGKLYTSVGNVTEPGIESREEAYQLLAREEFTGEVRTYLAPDGQESEEYYESLRSDPLGFYHGMLVKRGKTDYVLVGPPITFVANPKDISQEISEAEQPLEAVLTEEQLNAYEEDLYEAEEQAEAERGRIESAKALPDNHPCHGCLNIKLCDRSNFYAIEDGFACDQRVDKETAAELKEKATVKIPPELRALVEEKAGTRAQVLDLHELRLGGYRWGDLKQGYNLLDNVLDRIDNPDGCLEQCTQGFHYAFDSERGDGSVSYVCTNSKCLSKKKAAFTRARNAQGQEKKKAESKAIDQAVEASTGLDKPRMKLVILAQMSGSHIAYGYGAQATPYQWWIEKLGLKVEDYKKLVEPIFEALDKLAEEDIVKLIVEFMLFELRYIGEVEGYQIKTTMALNWMGIAVNV